MWMQRTAVIWLVYEQTHSTVMLGLTVFAEQFPAFLFSIAGGAVADRYNRFRVLMTTQVLSALQAIALTILAFTGHAAVWQLLALSAVLGIINAFDIPARQPLVHDIISDPEDLPNAIALNSTLNNLARLTGPAAAGFILEKLGAANCFLINAISFVVVIACLLFLKLPPYQRREIKQRLSSDITEGFRYIIHSKTIGSIIGMLSLLCLLVVPFNTLLPVYAKEIFHGNALTFGYINSFIGLGAVGGTFFLAAVKPGTNFRKLLLINVTILGIGLMIFSQLQNFALSMAVIVMCGFATMSLIPICNTILQIEAEPSQRGRVISYFAMAAFGMMPLGGLLIGFLSKHLGAPVSIFGQGAAAVLLAILFFQWFRQAGKNEKTP